MAPVNIAKPEGAHLVHTRKVFNAIDAQIASINEAILEGDHLSLKELADLRGQRYALKTLKENKVFAK